MKRTPIVLLTLALAACGGGKTPDTLEGKKARLAELKQQQAQLSGELKTLEADIAKLDPKKAEELRTKTVAVTPLAVGTFEHFIEVQGTVDAKNNVQVGPQSPGMIKAVYVKEGDRVGAGAVLARIDDQVMQESIAEIQNQLVLATTVFEKQKRLWEQQIGTELQYLQAKNNMESLQKRIQTLRAQAGLSRVTSPISGVVDKVNQKAGELASPGMPMFRVVNLSSLKAVAKISDAYVASVRKGDAVTVKFPDLKKEIKARITFVSTTVDPLSRTFSIEATLPSSPDLKPNMLAQVLINDNNVKDALVIDENLVQNTEDGQTVYVAAAEGNRRIARARTVKTGPSYNGRVQVLEGLQAGDQLITVGYQELTDGQPITY